MITNNPRVKEILQRVYPDSSVVHEVFIDSYPTADSPEYILQLAQLQPQIDHKTNLAFFRVDVKSGKVLVMESYLNPGEECTLEEWTQNKP